jgi:hypothetical protein
MCCRVVIREIDCKGCPSSLVDGFDDENRAFFGDVGSTPPGTVSRCPFVGCRKRPYFSVAIRRVFHNFSCGGSGHRSCWILRLGFANPMGMACPFLCSARGRGFKFLQSDQPAMLRNLAAGSPGQSGREVLCIYKWRKTSGAISTYSNPTFFRFLQ